MPGTKHFSIPYIKQLEKEEGWSRDPNSDHRYFVIRCHYMLTEKQSDDRDAIKIGDIIDTMTVIPGAPQEKTISREEETTTATIEESVKEALKENESVLEFVSTLSAEAGIDALGKVSSELKTTAQSKLKESFKNTFKVQYSETKREKKTNTWKVTVDPTKFEPNTELLIAKAYTGRSYDL
jgi:signal-transduction protein with cAMP-binding, CBS, and nucleotidyltransferase domain